MLKRIDLTMALVFLNSFIGIYYIVTFFRAVDPQFIRTIEQFQEAIARSNMALDVTKQDANRMMLIHNNTLRMKAEAFEQLLTKTQSNYQKIEAELIKVKNVETSINSINSHP